MSANPDRCPLCGGPNQCVLADPDAQPGERCWCVDEHFPEALIASVPAGDEARCICQRCLRQAAQREKIEVPLSPEKVK